MVFFKAPVQASREGRQTRLAFRGPAGGFVIDVRVEIGSDRIVEWPMFSDALGNRCPKGLMGASHALRYLCAGLFRMNDASSKGQRVGHRRVVLIAVVVFRRRSVASSA